MTTFEMANNVQNNLSQTLLESNQTMAKNAETQPVVNLNGSYMFTDEESMNSLLNQIGLIVQRQGGQNVN